jgi:hypothetical protein
MLLTTPYSMNIDPTCRHALREKFHLHPAILLVSRQISVEAIRVLYQENDFITLKVTGVNLALEWIPKFNLFSGTKIPHPLLQIEIAVANSSCAEADEWQTVITTSEGLQQIISAIWVLERPYGQVYHNGRLLKPTVRHGDLCVTLDFGTKASIRYELLKQLDSVKGLNKVVILGDFGEPLRKHLEIHCHERPFLDDVYYHILEYHDLADREFKNRDYNIARLWCTMLDRYWIYLHIFKPCRLRGCEIGDIDNESRDLSIKLSPTYFENRLKLVKSYLRQGKYRSAGGWAQEAVSDSSGSCVCKVRYEMPSRMRTTFETAIYFSEIFYPHHLKPIDKLELILAIVTGDWRFFN